MKSQRTVIARISPVAMIAFILMIALFLGTAVQMIIDGQILAYPERIFRPTNENMIQDYFDLAFIAAGSFIFGGLIYKLFGLILISLSKFEHIIVRDGRITFTDHPWYGWVLVDKITDVRYVRGYRTSRHWPAPDEIEITYDVMHRGKSESRSIRIQPYLYQETAEGIVANLTASGIDVAYRTHSLERAVWDAKSPD